MRMAGQMNIINEANMLKGLIRKMNYANSAVATIAILPALLYGTISLSAYLPPGNEGWGILTCFIIMALMYNIYIVLVVHPWQAGKQVGWRFISFFLVQILIIAFLFLLRVH